MPIKFKFDDSGASTESNFDFREPDDYGDLVRIMLDALTPEARAQADKTYDVKLTAWEVATLSLAAADSLEAFHMAASIGATCRCEVCVFKRAQPTETMRRVRNQLVADHGDLEKLTDQITDLGRVRASREAIRKLLDALDTSAGTKPTQH